MATRYWRGTTTAWGTAANWSGATAPIDSDTVIFDGDGVFNCTTDLDPDKDLAKLIVEDGYTGDLGATGGPLKIASAIVILRGQGQVFLQAEDTGGSGLIDNLVIASPNRNTITLSDDATDSITRCAILGGTVAFSANMVATARLEVTRAPGLPAPIVTIATSSNAITVSL